MTKLRITPVGTCRIHTPLRRAAARYPILMDIRRNYGFVHTSEEALQLVRFLQGDKTFQPQVAPLVARDGKLAMHSAEQWEPSDLHIVEVSSGKRITCGADAVQSNYLSHHFADFFASASRSRTFWSLVKKAHRQDLLEFLEQQETYKLLAPEDRDLLASLQVEPQSFKALKTDMAEIVDRLGKDSVLFGTHVNAVGPDGELIPARDRLIRWVKMAAEQLGVPAFDPTVAMQDFGQEKALESGGLDLTHFTPAFYDRVYEEIHRAHVVPLMGAGGTAQAAGASDGDDIRRSAKLEAMLELGDFMHASREVHSAIQHSPDALPLIELRGLIRARIGDFGGAVSDLTRRGDDGALSQAMRVGLVEALTATGDSSRALAVAEGLLAEEHESAALYRAAADAAEAVGKTEQAIAYAKQAFRKDRSDLSAALHALVLLADHRPPAETAAWRREVLENIGSSANGAFEISMWAVRNRDDDLFAAALKAVAGIDKPGTIDLMDEAFNAGMYRGVASSIDLAAGLGRIPRSLSERRLAIIDGCLDAARRLAGGRPGESYAIARGLLALGDGSNSQIAGKKLAAEAQRLIREMSQNVLTTIRDAYKAGDTDAVLALGEGAGDLLYSIPNGAALYARSLNDRGMTGEALDVMKKSTSESGKSFVATRWTARFAAISGDYATALEAFAELRISNEPEQAKVRPEIDRFFATAEARSLKAMRKLVVAGDFEPAMRLGRLIADELGARERVDQEYKRMHRLLRRRLREIEQGEGDAEEHESVLRQMTEIDPGDLRNLRQLALHLMQQFRFAEAAEVWDRIHALEPADQSSARQRERCVRMAERRVAAWGGDLDSAAA